MGLIMSHKVGFEKTLCAIFDYDYTTIICYHCLSRRVGLTADKRESFSNLLTILRHVFSPT